ncbi:TonB-dependent siderophore receptor [Pseudomonas asplenii]|uniref:TonB-dependent siderophore receptor n=1 Tax=Pseudomonas asplenii TaxID=53407 RepID=UPI0037C824AE
MSAAAIFLAEQSSIYAATMTQHYVIASGTLSAALLSLSQQSKQPIVFNPADLESRKAPALEGDFSLEQVLASLLDAEGLSYSRDSRGAIIIKPSPAEASNGGVTSFPAMVVYGKSPNEEGTATTSTETTRTDTPLRLTPQSITVINSNIMDAQGAQTVADALKNVAGVTVIPGSLGAASVNVRGYQSSVLSEGMKNTNFSTPLAVPTIALQAVETIKGPGAILSGSGSPGGTINLVYKKPQLTPEHEVRLGIGSYGERQISADTTDAVLGSDHLSYRIILDNKEAERSAGGYNGGHEFYFSPSLRWQDESTDISLRYTRSDRVTPFAPYTVGYNGKPYTGHLPTPLGNKNDSLHLQQNEFNLSLDQVLSEHWRYLAKANYTTTKMEQYGWYTGTVLEDDGTVWINTFDQGGESHQLNLDNYVRGNYEWGDLRSTTVFGFSAARARNMNNIFDMNQSQAEAREWLIVNVNEPLADLPSAKTDLVRSFSEGIPVGAYWQQQLTYGKWSVSAGLRFDSTWNGVFRREEGSASQNKQVWSPSIGVAYEVADWMTVYASHLQGYQPASFLDRNGNLLPAQISKQNEGGFKFSLFNEKLLLTTSVYKIEFSNYAYFDMDQSAYVATPGYVSRGFEFEAQGAITKNWDVVGSYSNGKSDFAKESPTHDGLPRNKASLWTRYRFSDGLLKGASLGAGVYYSGIAYLDRAKEFHIPPQIQTDLNIGYAFGSYNLDLVARNVFNKNLYVTSLNGDENFIPLQQPRSVQLTASYKF